MPKTKTELCPFCGELFATGIERGDHLRATHERAMSEVLADYDQARFAKREEERVNAG